MTEPVVSIPSNREPLINGSPTQRALLGGHRVALVHDWLTSMRGGEKVLEALSELLPDAEIFTLLHDQGTVSPRLEATCPHRSFVQYLPKARQRYRQYLPLFPIAIEQFDLDGFELVISTSHCAAKSIVRTGRARHLCYCFTPMRYAWDQFDTYFGPARVECSGADCIGLRSGGWLGGMQTPRTEWTAMLPSPNTLRGGSVDTIIGRLVSYIRRSTRNSSTQMDQLLAPIF